MYFHWAYSHLEPFEADSPDSDTPALQGLDFGKRGFDKSGKGWEGLAAFPKLACVRRIAARKDCRKMELCKARWVAAALASQNPALEQRPARAAACNHSSKPLAERKPVNIAAPPVHQKFLAEIWLNMRAGQLNGAALSQSAHRKRSVPLKPQALDNSYFELGPY